MVKLESHHVKRQRQRTVVSFFVHVLQNAVAVFPGIAISVRDKEK